MLFSLRVMRIECFLAAGIVLSGCGIYGYDPASLAPGDEVDPSGVRADAGLRADAAPRADASPGSAADAGTWSVAAPLVFPMVYKKTKTEMSIRFLRSPDQDMSCGPEIGYEVKGGESSDWQDVGGFPDAPCTKTDPYYEFSSLQPGTNYQLRMRAYRLIDGIKVAFSTESGVTASTRN